MIRTPELIDLLVTNLPPVQRLRPPVVRAAGWTLVAVFVLALLCVSQGMRPDLLSRFQEPNFAVGLGASLVTAICAAMAAFTAAVPGRSRAWFLLPLPPLLVWAFSIGRQCLSDWVRSNDGTMAMGDTARCFATLVLSSLPLWLMMLLMLRKTRPVIYLAPMLAGSVAVAAATATAMDLLHQLDTTVMILLWNFGTGALIVGISALCSRPFLTGAR